ncbi:MAG: outer membrane beta-barrel protein [Hyphomicrobiales bacterium]
MTSSRSALVFAVLAVALAAEASAQESGGGMSDLRGGFFAESDGGGSDDGADAGDATAEAGGASDNGASDTGAADGGTADGSGEAADTGGGDDGDATGSIGGKSVFGRKAAAGEDSRMPYPDEADDPFEPLGIRSGGMTYLPKIELRGGVTDNAARSATGKNGSYYEIAPELVGRSDWSRHSLEVSLRGTFRDYVSGSTDSEPTFNGTVKSQLDLRETTAINLKAGYDLSRESATDPDVAGVVDRPLIHGLTGSVGFSQEIGAFELKPSLTATRTIYERSAGGTNRNSTLTEAGLRATYDGGVVKPFVEAIALRRGYDDKIDGNGQQRAATGGELRGGVAFDHDTILVGEVALGYRREHLKDAGLADLEGWTLVGDVTWTISALTKVTVNARTDFNPSTVLGASGSVKHQADVKLSHSLRRNVVVDLGLVAGREDFTGLDRTDTSLEASAGATYKLNRTAAVTARARHERLSTTVPGEDYTANSFEVGLSLQR